MESSLSIGANQNQFKIRELDAIIDRFSDGLPPPPPTETDTTTQPPLHLQQQFEELYQVLHPALVDRSTKKNASAFLQGARGSGKSLTLDLVLHALQAELQTAHKPPFRLVRLHGLLVPGHQVALCVQEILRQLTNLAYQEEGRNGKATTTTPFTDSQQQEAQPPPPPRKQRKRSARAKEFLRLRRTCFTNQIQLLNEILQFACLDGVPVLFVLDELDAFVKSSGETTLFSTSAAPGTGSVGDVMDRQLLLYHLLDRVATDSSLVSFVGLTCHNGTMSMLEKRIRSRAEGTTRFIYFGPCSDVQHWYDIIAHKLQAQNYKKNGEDSGAVLEEWKTLVTEQSNETVKAERQQILDCFRRTCHLGYNIRWLFRVMSCALKLYRHDLVHGTAVGLDHGTSTSDNPRGKSSLQACLFQSLTAAGAPFLTASGEKTLSVRGSTAGTTAILDSRIQTVCDLCGPQVALVLAARRILARDSRRENAAPLTLERILEEYKSYKGSTNRYSRRILLVSFRDLLSTGLVRPASDSSSTYAAPLRYNMDPSFSDLSGPTAGKIELHLNLDIHREFQMILDQKLLDCSVALQEWGKRTT